MLLKTIRILLVTVFVLVAAAFGILVVYQYTHEDVQPPVFTSDFDLLEISVNASDRDLCAGLHAYDNVDGDISDRIVVKSVSPLVNATDAVITYLVFDESSNAATYTRTLRYTDYSRPRFALSQPLIFTVGDKITLLDRLSAYDALDGDLTGRILLTQSTISNSTAGSYVIHVQVTNSAGDTSVLPLTITVQRPSASMPTVSLKEYLIYVKKGETVDWSSFVASVQDPLVGAARRSDVICNTDKVDLSAEGTYEAYYYYIGKSGETATAILNVVVE